MEFSHIDKQGKAKMVDISPKSHSRRTARASGSIAMKPETVALLKESLLKKGDAIAAARIAGIAGAKKTSELIPLCHNIEIEHVDVDCRIVDDGVEIESRAACTGKTGIEMEALTAVTVAALTIYDMCKAVDKEMSIGNIRLVVKSKGG